MNEKTISYSAQCALEARLRAFDLAWQRGEAELSAFLPPRDDPTYVEAVRELVRRDLRQRWERGKPARLDAYRRDFPDLFARTEHLTELALEEYRQRARAGEPVSTEEYRTRYGVDVSGWPPTHLLAPPAGVSLDDVAREFGLSGRLSSLSQGATTALGRLAQARRQAPRPGEQVLDFILLRELGRGSFGRVFLARQAHLADRPVVLKVSPQLDDEPRTLAQLQHTNIVPIYSVHQLGPLQVVCMPYFGDLTLARVMHDLGQAGERLPRTGREFLAVLFERAKAAPPPEGAAGPTVVPRSPATLELLAGMPYVDVVLWLAARLADGLAHAHERGILHCDLKPENILVTDDGRPMLVDFNVSVDAKVPPELRLAQVGGTLPYMAPERLRLVRDPDAGIDGRSDLYSLGVILYRLLTGLFPFPSLQGTSLEAIEQIYKQRNTPPIPPRRLNPSISPAVDSIVRKLLEPAPGRRYASAADLQEDLERQLANRPLRYARDPSPVERLRKWRRRHPRLATAAVFAVLLALLVVLPGALVTRHLAAQAAQRRAGERAEAVLRQQAALNDIRAALVQLSSRGDRAMLRRGIDEGAAVVRSSRVGDEPAWAEQSFMRLLPPEKQHELRLALGELLLMMARGERLSAGGAPDGLRRALAWNRKAEEVFPAGEVPRRLRSQRRELALLLPGEGRPSDARDDEPPGEFDEFYDAVERAHAGYHEDTLAPLVRFTDRHPRHYLGWFARGVAHENRLQFAEAAAAFSVCVALQPDFPWAHLNRGVVRLRERRFAPAEEDFTRALELGLERPSPLINRALARKGLRRYREAEEDLTRALALPEAPPRIYFVRAEVRRLLGDAAGAARDEAEGLKHTPADALGWNERGRALLRKNDPNGALADFDAALQLNPQQWEALQNKALVLADYLNRPREAAAALDQLLEMYPTHVDARAGRGVYLARVGEKERAIRDADEVLLTDRSPFRLYQMAGLFAQLMGKDPTGEAREQALRLLKAAFRRGFKDFKLIDEDPDIKPLKDDPEFRRLLDRARRPS